MRRAAEVIGWALAAAVLTALAIGGAHLSTLISRALP